MTYVLPADAKLESLWELAGEFFVDRTGRISLAVDESTVGGFRKFLVLQFPLAGSTCRAVSYSSQHFGSLTECIRLRTDRIDVLPVALEPTRVCDTQVGSLVIAEDGIGVHAALDGKGRDSGIRFNFNGRVDAIYDMKCLAASRWSLRGYRDGQVVFEVSTELDRAHS